ncbi:7359_t:CDS:1, partial [Scutellospora calospora]
HDVHLARNIYYHGLRPSIPTHIPKVIAELITKCWDPQPDKRPSSKEIYETITACYDKSTEFIAQIENYDEVMKTFFESRVSTPSVLKTHTEENNTSRQFTPLNIADSDQQYNHL